MSTSKDLPSRQTHTRSGLSQWSQPPRILASVLLFGVALGSRLPAETWTDLRGTRSVDARMIGLWGDSVILELSGGRRVSVKLDALRSDSRIQAKELARELVGHRTARVQEMLGQANAASAAAPDPLPSPPAAPPYVAPKKDAKPDEFLRQIDDAVASGHLVAIYDALPPSYRKDVDEIVQLRAQKLSPATWQALVGTAQRLGDLIVTRQNWFLSSPRIKALPPDQYDVVEGQLLTFAGLLRAGLDPAAADLDQLQSVSFGQWLAERDEAVAPYLAQLVNEMRIADRRQIAVKSLKGGNASVTIDRDGVSSPVTLVLIEGYWVPKNVADNWDANVQAWKESPTLDMIDTLGPLLGDLAPNLDPMANAANAHEFHAAMETLLSGPAQNVVVTLATTFGKAPQLASRDGASRGGSSRGGERGMSMEMSMGMEDEMGMDDDMDMDMEMEMSMGMEEEMGMDDDREMEMEYPDGGSPDGNRPR